MRFRILAVRIIHEGALDKDVKFLRGDWCRSLCLWCDFAFDGKDIERAMKVSGLWYMERIKIRRALYNFLNNDVGVENSVAAYRAERMRE